jgi:hypothetical protein
MRLLDILAFPIVATKHRVWLARFSSRIAGNNFGSADCYCRRSAASLQLHDVSHRGEEHDKAVSGMREVGLRLLYDYKMLAE